VSKAILALLKNLPESGDFASNSPLDGSVPVTSGYPCLAKAAYLPALGKALN
jgi:hypothetical protein